MACKGSVFICRSWTVHISTTNRKRPQYFFYNSIYNKKNMSGKKNREFSRLHFVISNFHSVISRWFEISATESTAVSPFAQLLCIFIALLAFIESSLFKFFFLFTWCNCVRSLHLLWVILYTHGFYWFRLLRRQNKE